MTETYALGLLSSLKSAARSPCSSTRSSSTRRSTASAPSTTAASGLHIDDVDIEHLGPLGTDHITLTGRYRMHCEALPDGGNLPRAQRDPGRRG